MKKFELYTDGACKGNPGEGGWGVLLRSESGEEQEFYGYEPETTNNRMELQAVIAGLKQLPDESCRLTITTDSQYVKNGINQWIKIWKKNGWRTAKKEAVKNQDLWLELDRLLQKHQVEWRWVKGHSGHVENERVDALANRAIAEKASNLDQPMNKKKRQIILDTETTGLDAEKDRIIEIGCVELIDRQLTDHHYHQYIQPDRQIEAEALEVHGISNEFLADKPRFAEIVDEFIDYIRGAEIIAHNAEFDIGFIDAELKRAGKNFQVKDICSILDTLAIARKKHPNQRNTLDALCARYGVDNSKREKHGALLDAEILAEVYLRMTQEQFSLFNSSETHEHSPQKVVEQIQRLETQRPPLKIIRADAQEEQAHQDYLQKHHIQWFKH